MWIHYEYLLIIILLLSIFVALLFFIILVKKKATIIHSLSDYEKNEKLDANMIAKVEYINSKLNPLGLVYNLRYDLIYSTDNDSTIDKLRLIKEKDPELFEDIKDFGAIKRLL